MTWKTHPDPYRGEKRWAIAPPPTVVGWKVSGRYQCADCAQWFTSVMNSTYRNRSELAPVLCSFCQSERLREQQQGQALAVSDVLAMSQRAHAELGYADTDTARQPTRREIELWQQQETPPLSEEQQRKLREYEQRKEQRRRERVKALQQTFDQRLDKTFNVLEKMYAKHWEKKPKPTMPRPPTRPMAGMRQRPAPPPKRS
jgi:hypothetical protein